MEKLTQEQRKLQIIKDAYGKHYKQFKPDENGWSNIGQFGFFVNNIEYKDKLQLIWRPLSLKGIEDNNGWKSIESAADLPTERGKYWFIDKFITQDPYRIVFFDPNCTESQIQSFTFQFSDYQTVIKPLDKIY